MTDNHPITPPDELLEACFAWLKAYGYSGTVIDLRAALWPKPTSLKEEARQIIDCLIEGDCLNDDDAVTLRRVLEALPND